MNVYIYILYKHIFTHAYIHIQNPLPVHYQNFKVVMDSRTTGKAKGQRVQSVHARTTVSLHAYRAKQ